MVMRSPGLKISSRGASKRSPAISTFALDHVDGALLVIGVERSAGAFIDHHLGVEPSDSVATGDRRPKAIPAITRAQTPRSATTGRLAASKC
jgi:hypothetical protein